MSLRYNILKVVGIVITLLLVILILLIKYNHAYIKDNWAELKCVPYYAPFAGLFVDDNSAGYVKTGADNITKCLWVKSKSFFSVLIKPIMYIISIFQTILNSIKGTLDTFRQQLMVMREMLLSIVKKVMERLENLLAMFLFTFLKLRDTLKRSFASFKMVIYMLETTGMTLSSMINGPVGDMAKLGATLGYIMTYFLLGPLSIAMFPSLWLPVLCFSEDTNIILANRITTPIKNVKIGTLLKGDSVVTGVHHFLRLNIDMVSIGGDKISKFHITKYNGKYINSGDHPEARDCDDLFGNLITLTTSNGKIITPNGEYTDWDETTDTEINIMIKNNIIQKLNEKSRIDSVQNVFSKDDLYSEGFYFKKSLFDKYTKTRIGGTFLNSYLIGKSLVIDKGIKWYKHKNYDDYYVTGSTIVFNRGVKQWTPVFNHSDFIKIDSNYTLVTNLVTLTGNIEIYGTLFKDLTQIRHPETEKTQNQMVLKHLNSL